MKTNNFFYRIVALTTVLCLVFSTFIFSNTVRVNAEEEPIVFTKNRITYQIITPVNTSEGVYIGQVRIIGNKLKSSDTEVDILNYVSYKGSEYEITEIGDAALAFGKFEKITLPYFLLSIGKAAFYGCTELKKINLGDRVYYIGEGAFSYCNSLESMTIDYENMDYRMYNGMIYSDDLKTVISSGVATGAAILHVKTERIGDYAFEGNSRITSVTLKSGVKSIGDKAFYDCSNLESVDIPASVSEIKGNPFEYCPNLKNITVAKKNKVYAATCGALTNKSGKTLISCPSYDGGEYVFPEKVKHVGEYAFSGNNKIESITIPSAIKTIGAGAFNGCASLSSIKIVSCRSDLFTAPENASEKVFADTTHYLNVYLPYKTPSDDFMAVLKANCPSGAIYIKSK